jgi:hypothetical protein
LSGRLCNSRSIRADGLIIGDDVFLSPVGVSNSWPLHPAFPFRRSNGAVSSLLPAAWTIAPGDRRGMARCREEMVLPSGPAK